MGRIDDALRLTQGGTVAAPEAGPSQEHFAPAWQVSDPRPPDNVAGQPARLTERRGRVLESSGTVLGFSSEWRERLALVPDGNPTLVEQFRRLSATLQRAPLAGDRHIVMITSATPGDGKTLTAVNLAIVLSESFRATVLLIDADLRRPSIPAVIDTGGGAGLSEALGSAHEQKLALIELSPRLTLLPAGRPVANSIEALTSPRMREILDEAITRFDWVIVDAPPLGPTADARILAEMVGGTLFVIHAGKTRCEHAQKALESLERDRLIGIVFNGVDMEPFDGYYAVGPD